MRRLETGTLAMGLFFLLAGGAFFLEALGAWELRPRHIWPLLLIGVGMAVLAGARNDHEPEE